MQRGHTLLLLCGCLWLAACGDPLPEPTYRCTQTAHCTDGLVCVGGVCVSPLGDVAGTDSGRLGDVAAEDSTDAASAPCSADSDCALQAPCVVGRCKEGECVPVQLANGTTCTDGEVCPTPGHCTVGYCNVDGKRCDDGESCTFDACNEGVGCTHKPFADNEPCIGDGLACTVDFCKQGECSAALKPGHCLINDKCFKSGDADPEAPCNRCDPETFAEGWSGKTSGPCDDGDACTTKTTCTANSLCVGQAIACDDDNSCTDDSCNSTAGCVHLSNAGTCTDDDPCTAGGTCKDGQCKPEGPTDCDDGNPCTDDTCVEGFGCAHSPKNGGNCLADTDPCTDDVCKGGNCVAVPSISVCKIAGTCVKAGSTAASNPCKICSPQLDSKAWTVLDGAQCSDGNDCTSFDACTQGICVGEPTKCVDNNPCTKDGCEPVGGCIFEALSEPCNDDDKCTKDDFCVAGKCVGVGIPAATCNDGNPCTVDLCEPSFGCSSKPHPLPCDDGDKCTKNDLCSAGKCVAGQLVCPCESDADCNDSNSCTTDKCVLGQGCVNTPLQAGATCDDNDKCTAADVCNDKLCAGKDISCDDKNPCTKDGCVAEIGCAHSPLQGSLCDDGDKCTSQDLCLDGLCSGQAKNCDDGNACTDDACDPATALCKHTAAVSGSACPDDNIPCTVDQCIAAFCSHSEIAKDFCLISGACLSGGALHPAKQCTGCKPLLDPKGWSVLAEAPCKDGSACTVSEKCDKKGDCAGKPVSCDDGSPCTKDSCNPQAPEGDGCVQIAVAGSCEDGDKCTKDDTCSDGICKGTAIDCNDNDVCTADSCLTTGGCVHAAKADGSACVDDGLACTADVCLDGQCRHQVKAGACRIDAKCYKDGDKDVAKACMGCAAATDPSAWTAFSGGSCDDGSKCTGEDTCQKGQCVGDKAKACDDSNPCTTDACDETKGCSHAPNTGACEDGDLCTVKEVCKDGKCTAGEVKQCPNTAQNGSCEVTTCLPSKGCANVTTCGPLHGCVKGLCVTRVDGKVGPVSLGVPAAMAAQPSRPTIRWQEVATGTTGAVPRLWIAAQSNDCSPALAGWSRLWTAVLPPGESKPTFRALKTPSPAGGADWCAMHPVLRGHPKTFDAIVLGWLEGGGDQSSCAVSATGGQARVALLGLNGPDAAVSVPAKCPSGNNQPSRGRGDMWLLQAGPQSNKQDAAQLGGLLVRPGPTGALAFNGNVVGDWGGGSAQALPSAQLAGYTEAPTSARPVMAAWTTGATILVPSAFKSATKEALPALTALKVDTAGKPATKRSVLLTNVALSCDKPEFLSVEARYDPDVKRIGALISGTCETTSVHRGFLAFARVHPDQGVASGPKVAILHDVPKAVSAPAAIEAFRLAQLPNSTHFLAAWSAPGTAVIKAFRIEPKDDLTFKAVDLGAIAGNFAGKAGSVPGASNGGLSELIIAPDGDRYSLAWEGVGALHLLTATIPQ